MAKKQQAPKSEPAPKVNDAPLVLGTAVQGQLEDVALDEIDDPPERPDRLPRPDDQAEIAELARSLREVGQVQPVMVERRPGSQGGSLVRVFGRRRIAAARLAGMKTVRAIVVPELTPEQRRTIIAVENIQRKNLTPIEEHLGVWELCEMAAIEIARRLHIGDGLKPAALLKDRRVRIGVCDHVSALLAKTPEWVRDRMYIGRLGPDGRLLVQQQKLPLSHAREIAKVGDKERRERLAIDYAVGGEMAMEHGQAGDLADLREEVSRNLFSLAQVPWKLDQPFSQCVACEGCEYNSQDLPGLFDHGGEVSQRIIQGRGHDRTDATGTRVTAAGVCTRPQCFEAKMRESKKALAAACKRIEDGSKPSETQLAVLRGSAITARVKERAYMRGNRPKAAKKIPDGEDLIQKKRREEAEGKLGDALVERCKQTEPLVAAALAKTPGHWALFKLLTCTKLFEATEHYQEKKARSAAKSPGMKRALALLAKPSWESVIELEKECGRKFGLFQPYQDRLCGMSDLVAEALGIELPPRPTVEDFLAPAPADKQPKKAKKASKAKGRKHADPDQDDEDTDGDES